MTWIQLSHLVKVDLDISLGYNTPCDSVLSQQPFTVLFSVFFSLGIWPSKPYKMLLSLCPVKWQVTAMKHTATVNSAGWYASRMKIEGEKKHLTASCPYALLPSLSLSPTQVPNGPLKTSKQVYCKADSFNTTLQHTSSGLLPTSGGKKGKIAQNELLKN